MITGILTALLVVTVIGVIAGVLLALASHFFKVEENETVKAVRECLPGANCGACGFAGCDAYAEAVAEGKAEANLCIPGGPDVAGQLSNVPPWHLRCKGNPRFREAVCLARWNRLRTGA